MNKIKVDRLIHTIGLKYNLSDKKTRHIVESQFEFTAEKLKELDLGSLEHEQDIESIKSVFLYKNFGKLYLNPRSLINFIRRKNGRSAKHNTRGSSETS